MLSWRRFNLRHFEPVTSVNLETLYKPPSSSLTLSLFLFLSTLLFLLWKTIGYFRPTEQKCRRLRALIGSGRRDGLCFLSVTSLGNVSAALVPMSRQCITVLWYREKMGRNMGGRWKSTPLDTHEMSYNFTIATGLKLVRFELLPQFLVVIYFSVHLQCQNLSV